jgi:hypothetical protein
MLVHLLEAGIVIALAYGVVKHVGLANAKADIVKAVANADKAIVSTISAPGIVAGIKADLKKYLGV